MTTDTLLPFATPKTRNALIEQVMSRAAGSHSLRQPHRSAARQHRKFPAWEAALRAAQESVCIEMYIFAPDEFGRRIRAILLDKLAKGVKVAVYDWLGSLNAHVRRFFKPLIEAGAEVRPYNPPAWTAGIAFFRATTANR